MASTVTATGHRKTTGTTITISETHVTIKQINQAQAEENLTLMKMAETLAGQVAQLTEQQKKANSQSATNPVHSPGCWYDGVSKCQQHAPWDLGVVPSASAALGEAAFLKSGPGPQGSQPTIPKAISTPVPSRHEVTSPEFLSRNKLHAHLRDTGHSNHQPPESLRALTATIVGEDDSADKHYTPVIESARTHAPHNPAQAY
ncbi:unnamed protein product [Penicillium viridicatum]